MQILQTYNYFNSLKENTAKGVANLHSPPLPAPNQYCFEGGGGGAEVLMYHWCITVAIEFVDQLKLILTVLSTMVAKTV